MMFQWVGTEFSIFYLSGKLLDMFEIALKINKERIQLSLVEGRIRKNNHISISWNAD